MICRTSSWSWSNFGGSSISLLTSSWSWPTFGGSSINPSTLAVSLLTSSWSWSNLWRELHQPVDLGHQLAYVLLELADLWRELHQPVNLGRQQQEVVSEKCSQQQGPGLGVGVQFLDHSGDQAIRWHAFLGGHNSATFTVGGLSSVQKQANLVLAVRRDASPSDGQGLGVPMSLQTDSANPLQVG